MIKQTDRTNTKDFPVGSRDVTTTRDCGDDGEQRTGRVEDYKSEIYFKLFIYGIKV